MTKEQESIEKKTSEMSAFERKEFLWRYDKNYWHIKRAQEMKKKYGKQITSLEGNDPLTFFRFLLMSLSHWCIAIGIGRLFEDQYIIIGLIGWWLGGYWSVAAGLAIHEASHGLVFNGKWGSFLAGIFGEMPCFLPAYKTFQYYHMPHHYYISIDLGDINKREML